MSPAAAGSMDALIVKRPGAIALRRVPVQQPGADEVLVRVGAAGICGSDVELLEGRRPREFVRYPIVPGRSAWLWVVELVADGLLDPRALVSHSFPLARHTEAFATLAGREGDALKVQLTPQ
jgi:threonine dehydrogenase-like Zn-dependent dehydrogenase